MIARARRDLPIDMGRSFMVGDRSGDIVFAHRAGIPGVLVKTGYGLGEWEYQREGFSEMPDFVCEDLREAVGWILGELKKKTK